MRPFAFFATLLALSTALPLAAAHLTHAGCGSTSIAIGVVHADRYNSPCFGYTVSTPLAACRGFDVHPIATVHILILYDTQCQTGIVVQNIRPDGTTQDLLA